MTNQRQNVTTWIEGRTQRVPADDPRIVEVERKREATYRAWMDRQERREMRR